MEYQQDCQDLKINVMKNIPLFWGMVCFTGII